MIIDVNKVEALLNNSRVSGGRIAEETGITSKMVSKYRTGESKLMNMTLDTAIKFQALHDKIQGGTDLDIKIKGLKKAVGEFNNWQGAARIYFDKENLSVETYVYSSPGSYQQFDADTIVEVAQKANSNMFERDDTITMLKLKELCEMEIKN